MANLIAYGTLMVPAVMCSVSGCPAQGYCRRLVRGEAYPALIRSSHGDLVTDVLYRGLNTRQFDLLDMFEGEMYQRDEVGVKLTSGMSVSAQAYVVAPEYRDVMDDAPWSLEHFPANGLQEFVANLTGFALVAEEEAGNERRG